MSTTLVHTEYDPTPFVTGTGNDGDNRAGSRTVAGVAPTHSREPGGTVNGAGPMFRDFAPRIVITATSIRGRGSTQFD